MSVILRPTLRTERPADAAIAVPVSDSSPNARLVVTSGLLVGLTVLFPLRDVAAWTLVLTLLVAPVVEEIVFRVGLQDALAQAWPRVRAMAPLLTALAFAAAHVALRPTAISCLTLLPAWVLGQVYSRTRRVGPCIALHAGFNFVWLLAATHLK